MARKLHKGELDLAPSEAEDLRLFKIKHENSNIRLIWNGDDDATVTAMAVTYVDVDVESIVGERTLVK